MSTTTSKTIDDNDKGQKPKLNSNNKKEDSSNNEPVVSLKEAYPIDYDR